MNLTAEQQIVYDDATRCAPGSLFILKGYAGTGKTSTLTEIIKYFSQGEQASVLVLAPTAAAISVLRTKLNKSFDSDNLNFKDVDIDFKTNASFAEAAHNIVTVADGLTFSLDEDGIADFNNFLNQFGIDGYKDNIIFINKKMVYKASIGKYRAANEYLVDDEALYQRLKGFMNYNEHNKPKSEVKFDIVSLSELMAGMGKYDLIICDEMSMTSNAIAYSLVNALKSLRKNNFITLDHEESAPQKSPIFIMSGDSAQLPPVKAERNIYMSDSDIPLEDDSSIDQATKSAKSIYLKSMSNYYGSLQSKMADEFMNNARTIERSYQLTDILRSTDKIALLASKVRQESSLLSLSKSNPESVSFIHSDLDSFLQNYKDELSSIDTAILFRNKDVSKVNSYLRKLKMPGASAHIQENETLMITSNSNKNSMTNEIQFANGEEYHIKKLLSSKESKEKYDDLVDEILSSSDDSGKAMILVIGDEIEQGHIALATLVDKSGIEKDAFLFTTLAPNYQNDVRTKSLRSRLKNLTNLLNSSYQFTTWSFGYSRTIHKSQGSEWDNVAIILHNSDIFIAGNNLIYTAVTRAAKHLHVYVIQ